MPQMAPMNWVTLLLLFILIFYIFNTLNYFIFFNKKKYLNLIKKNKSLLYWKW